MTQTIKQTTPVRNSSGYQTIKSLAERSETKTPNAQVRSKELISYTDHLNMNEQKKFLSKPMKTSK